MIKFNTTLGAIAIALLSVAGPVIAQMPTDQGKMGSTAMPALTDGEVKKIDKDAGKITIKHGEIKHMEMPGMTMVFAVSDSKMLDKVKVGDKVRFMVEQQPGKMVVTRLDPAS
jgi:Cu(I)/Ag(I) efflux system periplasmic protein CusF